MRIILALGTAALLASPAAAVIDMGAVTGGSVVGLGGTFQEAAPPPPLSIAINSFESFDVIAFNEKQNFTLANNLVVNLGPSPILAGTVVSSHYVVFDTPSGTPSGTRTAQGTITFNQPVIGIITTNHRLNQSNYLGLDTVTYGTVSGLEAADSVTFSGKTVTFSLASTGSTADMFRVITTVPEPGTWAMLVGGFGLVGAASRRRRKTVAA